jgi:serine/threonine protein kinase
MDISAATWNTVSKLLDEALDLEPAARAVWFEQLSATQPALAPSVHKLLAAHASSETDDVLAKLPLLPQGTNHVTALSPGDRVGPYRLKRELGVGGMADVWLAERADGAFTRDVALKLPMISRLRRDLAQRFARERDILARLEHPNIARLYDAGVSEDSLPYLAMEYVDGQPITEYCDANKLGIEARLKLFGQVLDAVTFAHANLVIHRDLKPSNILVTGDGQVRLLDFGIAKLMEGESTRETHLTQLAGRALTPDYASPEQIKGEPLTIATDVYSLGVVLYEVLTEVRPYKLKRGSAAELEEAIAVVDAPLASTAVQDRRLKRGLTGDLDAILNKALKKSPAERYPSVEALAADIERKLAGLPVLARPDSIWYRLSRFVLRHKLEAGAVVAVLVAIPAGAVAQAAVLIAIAGGAAVALWQARVARQQAQRAAVQADRAERVKRFVLSIFESADAETGGSASMSAAEVLQRARQRVDDEVKNDPQIAVELLTSIGRSLVGLNEDAAALPILADATRLAGDRLPPRDTHALEARVEYAQALFLNGRVAEARKWLAPTIEALRQERQGECLVMALRLMATVCRSEARLDDSVTCAQEAVQLAEQRLGPQQLRPRMYAYLSLAWALKSAGKPGMLEPARRGYELARQAFSDPQSGAIFDTREAYAVALVEEGDAATGLREMKEVVAAKANKLGPRHRATTMGQSQLGHVQMRTGFIEDAIATFRMGVDLTDSLEGDVLVPDRAVVRLNLGQALMSARRFEEAGCVLEEAEQILSHVDPLNDRVHLVRAARAAALAWSGLNEAAEPMLLSLTPLNVASLSIRRLIESYVASAHAAQGRHLEACNGMRVVVNSFDASTPDSVPFALALGQYGAALVECGEYEEAVAILERADAMFRKRQLCRSPDNAEAVLALGRCHLKCGRLSDAVASLSEAEVFWRGFDAASRCAGVTSVWYSRALRAADQLEPAMSKLKSAQPILAASPLYSERELFANAVRDMDRSLSI